MATSPNGTEKSPKKQEVVVGFLSWLGQLHWTVHYFVEVRLVEQAYMYKYESRKDLKLRNKIYLEHLLIFSSKQRHRAKDQFEEFKVEIWKFDIGAHLWQSLKKILHKNGGK